MNGLDILSLAVFAIFVIICAIKGLLGILAKWGSLFAAIILSKLFGGMLGEMFLSDVLGNFAPIVGTALTFALLYLLLRIILGGLAKLIKNVLHVSALDHILGGVVGAVGGLAIIFLFTLLLEVFVTVVGVINENAEIISNISNMVEDSSILKYFVGFVGNKSLSLF